jgi:formate hydrogenlyase subunit 3/multisubunit Na+/H+ antiporter MnhD subunit
MSVYILFLVFILPLLVALGSLRLKSDRLRWAAACTAIVLAFAASVVVFFRPQAVIVVPLVDAYRLAFGLNRLSIFILMFINGMGLAITLFSKNYYEVVSERSFFPGVLGLVAFASLAVLSMDFITFSFAWGAGILFLYCLLAMGSAHSATKAVSIVGFSDFCGLFGIGLYICITKSSSMPLAAPVLVNTPLAAASFALMTVGAFAKSGCMPLHTWIPTAAKTTPVPALCLLPASMDKLLGIYFLARVCTDFFVLSPLCMGILLLIGGLTVIFAVTMALIQHDVRELLGYHAISQVGYMVLGFACATPIGIAAGIFHMINNVIYKSGLFLSAGAVAQQKKTFELDKLGGLAAFMPLTFGLAVLFSLSISGVPPLNGFASKWLLYQSVIAGLFNASDLWLKSCFAFGLLAAMFGSVLTLASFVKFVHAIFLGNEKPQEKDKVSEAPACMIAPLAALGLLCVLAGLFPQLVIKQVAGVWLGTDIVYSGSWNSMLAFILVAAALVSGVLVWLLLRGKHFRQDSFFVGGELTGTGDGFPATEFYKTVEETFFLKRLYRFLKTERFDFYLLLKGALERFAGIVSWLARRIAGIVDYGAGLIAAVFSLVPGVPEKKRE